MIRLSENTGDLFKALAEVQKAMPPIKREGKNPHHKSTYATLDEILKIAIEKLNENGLMLIQSPECEESSVAVTTTIVHVESGQRISVEAATGLRKTDDPQVVGAAITYMRRYGLSCVLALATEEDDDANAAVPREKPQVRRETPKPQSARSELVRVVSDWAGIPATERNDIRDAVHRLARADGIKLGDGAISEADAKKMLEGCKAMIREGVSFADAVKENKDNE